MNVPNLKATNLPAFPADPDQLTWPWLPASPKNVLRFRWDESWEDETNWESIRMIVFWLTWSGPESLPYAKSMLEVLSDPDVEQRVIKKFQNLQIEWKKLNQPQPTAITNGAVVVVKTNGLKQQLASRAKRVFFSNFHDSSCADNRVYAYIEIDNPRAKMGHIASRE